MQKNKEKSGDPIGVPAGCYAGCRDNPLKGISENPWIRDLLGGGTLGGWGDTEPGGGEGRKKEQLGVRGFGGGKGVKGAVGEKVGGKGTR